MLFYNVCISEMKASPRGSCQNFRLGILKLGTQSYVNFAERGIKQVIKSSFWELHHVKMKPFSRGSWWTFRISISTIERRITLMCKSLSDGSQVRHAGHNQCAVHRMVLQDKGETQFPLPTLHGVIDTPTLYYDKAEMTRLRSVRLQMWNSTWWG